VRSARQPWNEFCKIEVMSITHTVFHRETQTLAPLSRFGDHCGTTVDVYHAPLAPDQARHHPHVVTGSAADLQDMVPILQCEEVQNLALVRLSCVCSADAIQVLDAPLRFLIHA